MAGRSPITTHVLDTAVGRPLAKVPVTLDFKDKSGWKTLGTGETNGDGRVETLLSADSKLSAGIYRLTFEKLKGFFPQVAIVFEVSNPSEHYHVPLLISGHGYSTYRGS